MTDRDIEIIQIVMMSIRIESLSRVEGTAEVDDDLVGDVTEILTSLCARLYGRRAAANRAVAAATAADES